ncbi:MAG: agmatine deiminase [Clostridia bacterium]|nr:agmatine deiminase [Clostridia bacterium]
MTDKILHSTPREDGFYMPAEYAPQRRVWMLWPERPDNWRDNAKPAQEAYAQVAIAVSEFAPVTVGASKAQFDRARKMLPDYIRVIPLESDDAWMRDVGPTFLVDGKGGLRAADWTFNAWGGLYDGLYAPWDRDDKVAAQVAEAENAPRYRTEGFVLEGGSIHVDGEGTVMTTEMCLLSPGRNPHLGKAEIEGMLCSYLGTEKVIWLRDGIDPEETNGHIDDVACFVRPGEVACIDTQDPSHPFYEAAQAAVKALETATDAKGRRLKVHRVALPKKPVLLAGAETIAAAPGSAPRKNGDLCIASYLNFLICNGGVIVPQYDDENDALALRQLQAVFPDKKVVGVRTREIVYGGGNIHCITQQVPDPTAR